MSNWIRIGSNDPINLDQIIYFTKIDEFAIRFTYGQNSCVSIRLDNSWERDVCYGYCLRKVGLFGQDKMSVE